MYIRIDIVPCKYFLIGSVAAAFLLYGIALIYGSLGTTNLGALGDYRNLTSASDINLFIGGVAMVTIGLAFKAAIVPFHTWSPDVYGSTSYDGNDTYGNNIAIATITWMGRSYHCICSKDNCRSETIGCP